MAENVELKARLADPAATVAAALAAGASDQGVLVQRDTYYRAARGRLKLRETEGRAGELIAYDRADDVEAKLSRYVRAPADASVGEALAQALVTRIVVAKQRRLLTYENVRIHVDEVEGLGSFLEFEAVLGPADSRADGEAKLAQLQRQLGIAESDLVAAGYADLLEQSAETLKSAATDAWGYAYAPYSNFRVGAAIRGASGAIYTAANVENAAYSQAQCAEASAIGVMIAAGEQRIAAVAVASEQLAVCTPCGGCRQRLAEFAAPDTPVYLGPETYTLEELLPMGFTPVIGIVLGSGLGAVAGAVENPVVTPYTELAGFPQPTVAGHAGQLTRGQIAGRDVTILQGRAHLYEGGPVSELITPIRWLKQQGADTLVLTNAAGSLRPEVGPASLMAITDHINLTGVSILRGPNDDRIGPRFPPMRDAYDRGLLTELRAAAAETGVSLAEGVYCGWMGPAFETPAEIRAIGALGADAVGMSTVHETVVARHCGLKVAAISAITNLAEGLSDRPLSHAQTLADAERASGDLTTLLLAFIARI